jgi:hypothetical protein
MSDTEMTLEEAERSSALLAANILLHALGWSYGGLHAMACEIVSQRDALRAELAEARREWVRLREALTEITDSPWDAAVIAKAVLEGKP